MKMDTTAGSDVAEISLGELHDIFASAHQFNVPEEGDYSIGAYKLAKSDLDKLSDEEKVAMQAMLERLNKLVREYRSLDSEFHDWFDCR